MLGVPALASGVGSHPRVSRRNGQRFPGRFLPRGACSGAAAEPGAPRGLAGPSACPRPGDGSSLPRAPWDVQHGVLQERFWAHTPRCVGIGIMSLVSLSTSERSVARVAAGTETRRAGFCSGSPLCFVTAGVTSYWQKAGPFLTFDKTVFPGIRLRGVVVLVKDKAPRSERTPLMSTCSYQALLSS